MWTSARSTYPEGMTRGRWMALSALTFAVAAVVGGALYLTQHGVSAREEPLRAEAFVARRLRHLAIPRGARDQGNPLAATPDIVDAGLAHFADHCAICHANDGSGETTMGRNLYPKAPDMRLRDTQDLSDGELFYIIENGIRFTGMPAWGNGTSESARDTWALVHFIRRLPRLTPPELERMKSLNPKSPDEWREEEERQFLNGTETGTPRSPDAQTHEHHQE